MTAMTDVNTGNFFILLRYLVNIIFQCLDNYQQLQWYSKVIQKMMIQAVLGSTYNNTRSLPNIFKLIVK